MCDLGDVLVRFMAQTCARRQQVGAEVLSYTSTVDVKDALRQLPIERENAPMISYVVTEYIVIEFGLAFGCPSSPG